MFDQHQQSVPSQALASPDGDIPPRPLDEELISLKKLAQLLDIHVSTVTRWCFSGTRGRRLWSCLIGGRRITSRRAVDDFIASTATEALTAPQSGVTGSPALGARRSPSARRRDSERAAAELARLGI